MVALQILYVKGLFVTITGPPPPQTGLNFYIHWQIAPQEKICSFGP